VNLGTALADQYDLAGGLAEFSAAIRLDPNSAKAHYDLDRFYFYTAKFNQARQELETAGRIQRGSATRNWTGIFRLSAKAPTFIRRSINWMRMATGFSRPPGSSSTLLAAL
jgi:tetratricopeptide (TPR) repeat protein